MTLVAAHPIVLVANARMPSQRANSLQIASAAAAFARAGRPTTLVHALRYNRSPGTAAPDLWEYYGVPPGPHPQVVPVGCVDLIDRVPRRMQFVPARVQELSFARRAALRLSRDFADAWILSRELEVARHLLRRGVPHVFLEIHRVPGGRLRRRWLLEAAGRSPGVLAISGGVAEDLLAIGVPRERVRVEHDAFEPARFAGLPSRAEARAELAIEPDARVVVYTGGLLRWKGLDLLVEAARQLPALTFVIAGGMDADVAELRALTVGRANVRIEGFQPPERVGLYLAAGDLGVVPNRSTPAISARYTSPLKVFEAMAVGLPLVASDLPSLRELLTDGEDALLVAPDDAGALARGIARMADDADLRERCGARLRARAAEHTYDARAARILVWMRERVDAAEALARARGAQRPGLSGS